MKCRYGCGGYGSSRLCPPHSPTPDETRKVLDGYRQAVLIHGDKTTDIRRIVTALEREAFLGGFYKAFAFACGPCGLCRECAFEKGCRHPERARPAMEACGIDVYRTARAAGFPIEVVRTHADEQNYYGLLLLE
jgi:predicted metal-binding protein